MAATVVIEDHYQKIERNRAEMLMAGGAMATMGGMGGGVPDYAEPRPGVTYTENTIAA